MLNESSEPMILAREARMLSCSSPLSMAHTDCLVLVPKWTSMELVPMYFSKENMAELFINFCGNGSSLAFSNVSVHKETII